MSLEDIDNLENDPVLGDYQVTYHEQIHGGMKSLKTLAQTTDTDTMKTSGVQTIGGTKTFSSAPVMPTVEWISLANPGFELTSTWNISAGAREYDATTAHSGTRSLKMIATGTVNDANSENIAVVEGDVYYAEAWVKWTAFNSGANATFGATTSIGGSSASWPSFYSFTSAQLEVAQTQWIKISGTITIPAGKTHLLIRPSLRDTATSGTMWFDDIRLAKITSATSMVSKGHIDYWSEAYEDSVVPGQEIALSNPDFELTSSWATSSTKVYDTTRAYEGTRSMRLDATGPEATISEVSSGDYITVAAGEQYYAECYAWWEGIVQPSGTGIVLQCSIHDSGGVQISIPNFKFVSAGDATQNSNGWVKLFGTITMPANAASLRMRIAIREGATAGSCWFDRVRVRKLTNQSALYYRGDKTWRTLDKAACGLANVSNTTDANKPVSTAQQTALNTKENNFTINLLSNTGFEDSSNNWTLNNITLSTTYARNGTYSAKYTGGSGLGEIISPSFPVTNGQVVTVVGYIYHPGTTTGQGIRIQAQKISDDAWVQVLAASTSETGTWERETLTYTVDGATYDNVRLRFEFNSANDAYVDDAELYINGVTSTTQYYRGDKTWQTLDSFSVGLGEADNTSDTLKPVSNATQTALDAKQDSFGTGETFEYLRGDKTWRTLDKTAVGLANVDNTSDANKPISTATQTALNAKADISGTLALTGNQTTAGIKTFSSSPKLVGGATVGYVWKATSTDGAGSWQDIGELVTTVDWANITSKPATFAPTIGTTSTTAAAGNHTHTKADIGLGNADNTSDTNKPISTATQTALDAKTATSRTFSTSSHFTGGGDLSANRTLAFATGGVGLADMDDPSKKIQIAYVQTLDTRAVGYGQLEDGFKFQEAVTITSVAYRMGTADASGTTTCELRKNGVAVSGTSGTASTSPTAVTGTWSFASGDILTVYTSAIGTTPGKRLTADILAVKG